MNRIYRSLALATGLLGLAGCATTPGPVEVTRFVSPTAASQLGQGTIAVTTAPGQQDGLETAAYRTAVAQELARLGYTPTDGPAGQVAQIEVERHLHLAGEKRSPVSVGVGGSTGGYGSGLGLGVGINLGGGPRNQISTQLSVKIKDASSGQSLWEGRADLSVKDNSPLADRTRNAQTLAEALFRNFPGNSGETVSVKVNQ